MMSSNHSLLGAPGRVGVAVGRVRQAQESHCPSDLSPKVLQLSVPQQSHCVSSFFCG